MKQILKVLVGSQSHGLATEDSDLDYRGVFITPTSELVSLKSGGYKGTHWVEGQDEDNTSYEIAHFLHLATKSNPSILEVFSGPVIDIEPEGKKLKELFEYCWSSKGIIDAFGGYSLNQRKKMLDDKYPFRERKWKYATAYARVLIQGSYLLKTGTLISKIPDNWLPQLKKIKEGKWSIGMVLDFCEGLKLSLYEAFDENPDKQVNLEPIQEYVLDIRKNNW